MRLCKLPNQRNNSSLIHYPVGHHSFLQAHILYINIAPFSMFDLTFFFFFHLSIHLFFFLSLFPHMCRIYILKLQFQGYANANSA